ncbi:MAG: RNA polymerase subunit sigma [Phycisphaeraceae bacterium]|nr:RNA polymerase subunit sigma [Phycisphaeraceae bacterium]
MSAAQADPRSDEQLVQAIRTGDVDAFEVLYRRHRDWVVNLAYRFTRDRDRALDVMQETFAYVSRKAPTLELTARFTTFLYPVVHHLAIAEDRRARRHTSVPEEVLQSMPAADQGGTHDPRTELAAVLERLSEAHREVVLLRFVDGLSLDEIARALEIPAGTVKSRLHHAIRTLRADPRVKKYFEA